METVKDKIAKIIDEVNDCGYKDILVDEGAVADDILSLIADEAHLSVSSSAGLEGPMEERSKWIKINDKPPETPKPESAESEKWFLVCNELGENICIAHWMSVKRAYDSGESKGYWMELPEPPKAA